MIAMLFVWGGRFLMEIAGFTFSPSQVNLEGIFPFSVKEGLLICSTTIAIPDKIELSI
jgi:hypothetical protein